MGSSLVEDDDCNNLRKERGLQKASRGVLEEVREEVLSMESWRSIAGNWESLRLRWEGLRRSCESLTGSGKVQRELRPPQRYLGGPQRHD